MFLLVFLNVYILIKMLDVDLTSEHLTIQRLIQIVFWFYFVY